MIIYFLIFCFSVASEAREAFVKDFSEDFVKDFVVEFLKDFRKNVVIGFIKDFVKLLLGILLSFLLRLLGERANDGINCKNNDNSSITIYNRKRRRTFGKTIYNER